MRQFTFPVGYHDLHKTKIIDYQLNRWHSLGYVRLEDMRLAGQNIRSLDDWKSQMVRLADKALTEGRLMDGAFLYRAAEFFAHPSDPDKKRLYDKFITLFYDELMASEPLQRFKIPYGSAYLTGFTLPAQGAARCGHIVIHGGFDSFIEELVSVGYAFAHNGYDVVMFDGPGQGAPLKEYNLPIDYHWELPAKAILDHFGLEDVTWLGFSMGGWLCFRAAANEPRIQRVIASSIAYDYMKIPPPLVERFARWLMTNKGLFNALSAWKMKMLPQEKWGIDNLMYITRQTSVLEASEALLAFNEVNLQSAQVTQDVLILTGEEDHFIPMKLHHLQVKALSQARSLTARVFTRADEAQNHCQVGNIGLAVEVMLNWLAEQVPETAVSQQ
jgi:pimeloyl-ACP methyl ester carboxylesterase